MPQRIAVNEPAGLLLRGDDVSARDFITVCTKLIESVIEPATFRGPAGDGVDRNDMAFNKVFPYESTPQNGRNHQHP